MRLVVGGGADPKIDLAILKTVARANQWFTELLSGGSRSLVEIAKREGVGNATSVESFGWLSSPPQSSNRLPAIGHQPPELTAQALSTRRGLPLSWQAQRELFGFEARA
jgi:hypothetical protein